MTVKFYSSKYQSTGAARYQHTSVVLAEGLSELGIDFWGNNDYWYDLEINDYRIRAGEGKADVNVYSSQFLLDNPSEIDNVDYSQFNILIDNEDGFDSPAMDLKYQGFDIIFRCHYNSKFERFKYKIDWAQDKLPNYLPQTLPWNFGMSNRIIKYIDNSCKEEVEERVLVNFRFDHNIRSWGKSAFFKVLRDKLPIYDKLTDTLEDFYTTDKLSYWAQTGRRHNPQYFVDLNRSKYILAFGGKLFFDPIGNNIFLKLNHIFLKILAKFSKLIDGPTVEYKYCTMTQYGGWRLFEALYSPNTVPVQINLEQWKCIWPVLPEAGVHYLAVDGLKFEKSAKSLLKLTNEEYERIAKAGREWVSRNYSPRAVAERFIKIVNEKRNKK
jgi:hypothetical protein